MPQGSDVVVHFALFLLTDGVEFVETSLEPFPEVIEANGGRWVREGTRDQYQVYRYHHDPLSRLLKVIRD